MPFNLGPFAEFGLDSTLLRLLLAEHASAWRPRSERFWRYYRNPTDRSTTPGDPFPGFRGAGRPRLAQEAGLPPRLTGARRDPSADDRDARREIVIENDIAWRLQTMVDFMFGRPVQIVSTAADPAVRATIERTLDAAWEASGGIALLQDMALLGHVYGHIDLALRLAAPFLANDPAEAAAESLRVEAIEPTRGIPLLSPSDYRRIDAYIIHFTRRLNRADRPGALKRLLQPGLDPTRAVSTITEVQSARWRQVFEQTPNHGDEPRLIDSAPNTLTPGALPVVHIQNISQPFRYEGQGEVEPLIPLQDELNTRLSDRASRVTLQSFKMYLAKGLSGFEKGPVGPGQIWSTDNPDATVEAFGGDAASPSEDAHIEQVREALDKTSAIPPLASGVVRARIGNLSSANALRITLMGTLAKTARKRVTYGRGIAEMSRLILQALDHAGILRTESRDRNIRLVWADPIPEDIRDQVASARAKQDLGVPPDRVLAELGYGPSDPGVM
jgi:hypothetical protein